MRSLALFIVGWAGPLFAIAFLVLFFASLNWSTHQQINDYQMGMLESKFYSYPEIRPLFVELTEDGVFSGWDSVKLYDEIRKIDDSRKISVDYLRKVYGH